MLTRVELPTTHEEFQGYRACEGRILGNRTYPQDRQILACWPAEGNVVVCVE